MKEFMFVLKCSIIYAMVMIAGLALQSCRASHKVVETQQHEKCKYKAVRDTTSFASLVRQHHENKKLTFERFEPVYNPQTGEPSGTQLAERVTIEEESTEVVDSTKVDKGSSAEDADNEKEIEVKKESKRAPPGYLILTFIILFIILGFYINRRF